jgi:A/G-specific adenine glycosylase
MADVQLVQTALLDWYAREARDLPWRHTRDPYAVLVAEVMLQQTQVDRVIPKWHAWLSRFPTLADLAQASRADAIRAWQGLGYNLRAVRLHTIARQAMTDFGGELPRSIDDLMRLKGIGRYTAGAIACFAFEQPVAMVDTNVRRVLGRVFGVPEPEVNRLAERVLPQAAAYAWGQALMDLGATLCRPRRPRCLVCPVLSQCAGPLALSRASRRAPAFAGSRRFRRGRILDLLRTAEAVPLAHLGDPELVARMAEEGLVEITTDGQVRLAS